MTNFNFLNTCAVPLYFTLLINQELNRRVNRGMFLSLITLNTPFLSRLVISLQYNVANYGSHNVIIGVGISLLF
jgi:hypothetical protein